MNSENKDRD